jgi:hypothetical protein
MPADAAKQVLRSIRQQSPTLKLNDRKYKQAYSDTVMALVEEVLTENEQLVKQFESVGDMLKIVVNQSELAVHQMKQLRKAVEESNSKLKSLPKADQTYEGDESEEVDHQGE